MGNNISTIADIMGIIGFGITILTLLTTLRVKKSITITLDTRQYFKRREKDLHTLLEYIDAINNLKNLSDASCIMRKVDKILQEISGFSIWSANDKSHFQNFLKYNQNNLLDLSAMDSPPESAVTVRAQTLEEFKNEYCSRINEVYAIIDRDSAISNL